MATAFHQTHNLRHRPIGNLQQADIPELAETVADRITKLARAHSADSVVFVAGDGDVHVIVETSGACVQRERSNPTEVVGRWRRPSAEVIRLAIEAHMRRVGIFIA